MRALVIANCTTQTYVEGLQKLFPEWEVRGAAADLADRWLADGSKPEFTAYLAKCDVFVGEPPDGRPFGDALNPAADKVLIPGLHFRGLHPDIATLPDFRGPFSVNAPNTQCSLITLAAKAAGLAAAEAVRLFNGETYRALGFFNVYQAEKTRVISLLASHGIDVTADWVRWEGKGAFFHVCHHPAAFVLIDILRQAMRSRHLDESAFVRSAASADEQVDHLARMEIWPVYPELASTIGFSGNLTWLIPGNSTSRRWDVTDFVNESYRCLDAFPGRWKDLPFVQNSALSVMALHESTATSSAPSQDADETLSELGALEGAEKEAVLAALASPFVPELLHKAMEMLRHNHKFAALDRLYETSPDAMRLNHAIMSVWCSVPRIRRDKAEQMRRAEAMVQTFPNDAKSVNHLIFALYENRGFEETMRRIEGWMKQFPDNLDVLGPSATIALYAQQYDVSERLFRHLETVQHNGLEAGSYRMLIIALVRQGKDELAARTLAEARSKYPGHEVLADL